MDVIELIEQAEADGVKLQASGGQLQIEAPKSKRHWLEKLSPLKSELVAHLDGNGNTSSPEPEEVSLPLPAYEPFPVNTLPAVVADYVKAAAAAIGCDASFVALPLLCSLARAIGNSRVIRLKRTWTEPSILWAAIVGKSGTHKTPSLNSALKFLETKQADSIAKHKQALQDHERDLAQYERDYATWKRSKSDDLPPWKPEPPICNRYLTSDCTIEALTALLAGQFDGLLVARDELAGWLHGIAEYKGGKGSDLGHWLAVWSAGALTVDRKSGPIRMMHVPRAAVSLVGGVQPGVLRTAIGREHMQDGLCARLLLAMPRPRPVVWTDETVSPEVEQRMAEVFDRLCELEPAGAASLDDEYEGEVPEPEPFPLDLTPEAKAVWVEYFNRHRAELADLDDDLAAAWSKLEAYTARLALVFQLCTWATGDAAAGHAIDQLSIEAAIELTDWFGNEAKRVYGMFNDSPEERAERELVELIERRGGAMTPRDLAHASRQYRKPGEAEAALEKLAGRGLGTWQVESTAGRPKRCFLLDDNKPTIANHRTAEHHHHCNGHTGNGNKSPTNTG
ncbi:MAG: DUF3987 domain-containing protein [Lacipirellulaceae bacterium]